MPQHESYPDGELLTDYTPHEVPFDEWADLDTLAHRTSVTSGDFDFMLRPLCPDCAAPLEFEYEELEEGESLLSALVCHACRAIWEAGEPEDA